MLGIGQIILEYVHVYYNWEVATVRTTDSSVSGNRKNSLKLFKVLNPIRPDSEQINEQNVHTLKPFLSNVSSDVFMELKKF